MPSSSVGKAQIVNKHLTQLAQGFQIGEAVGELILPVVKIDVLEFSYIEWDKNSIVVGDHLRGLTAPVKVDEHKYTIKTGKLPDGYSYGVGIDRREIANSKSVSNVDLAAQKLNLEHGIRLVEKEYKAASLVTNVASYDSGNHGNVSNAGSGGWSDPDTDIFADILTAKLAVQNKLGVKPNVLVATPDVMTAIRKNNIIKSFFLNTTPGAAAFSLEALAQILGVDKVVEPSLVDVNGPLWGTGFAALIYSGKVAGNGVFDPKYLPASFGWTLQLDAHPFVEEDYVTSRTAAMYYIHDNYLHLQTSNIAGYMFESVLT
jgi:hypothetical protein